MIRLRVYGPDRGPGMSWRRRLGRLSAAAVSALAAIICMTAGVTTRAQVVAAAVSSSAATHSAATHSAATNSAAAHSAATLSAATHSAPTATTAASATGASLSPARPAPPPFPRRDARLEILQGHGGPFGVAGPTAFPDPSRAPFGFSGAPAADEVDDYDWRYVALDIDIRDTENQWISGTARHRIESRVPLLSEAVFHLSSFLEVSSVLRDGAPAAFTHETNLIRITLDPPLPQGETAEVSIAYFGNPQYGGGGMRFQFRQGTAWVWTQSEPTYAHTWWPCKDVPSDKADSATVRITAPEWMTATSNGVLRSIHALGDGSRVWTWHESYPIVTYLISVTGSDFVRVDESYPLPGGGTLPIHHYVFSDQEEEAREDFSIAPAMMGAFEDLFGPYPFRDEKYGITVYGWGGAMEHQCNTSYGWFLISGDHHADWIYAHEMAHQWWGDEVTCATWADIWLNEGFASWSEAAWVEAVAGPQAYRDYMVDVQTVWDPSGPVYNYQNPFDGNTIYNKGAWVVHMLRGVLGDSAFFPAIRHYRDLYAGRSVTTEQFQAAIEESSGRDLDWFFDPWLYGTDRPEYLASSRFDYTDGAYRAWVHLEQRQVTRSQFFPMPVRVRILVDGAPPVDTVLWNDERHDDLVVRLPGPGLEAKVDPDRWILREVGTGPYELYVITADLPEVPADSAVSVPLTAKGGEPPYRWLALDPLPSGTLLDTDTGVLSGAPADSGYFSFRVQVSDRSNPTKTDIQRIVWEVTPALADSGGPVDPPPLAPPLAEVRAAPNPALRSTRLSFRAPEAGSVSWRVFDLQGRAVARFEGPTRSAGVVHAWVWDGVGEDGRRLGSGLYFARAGFTGVAGIDGGGAPKREAVGRVLLLD